MIPTPQQLEDIASRQEGSLQEIPFSPLLCALSFQKKTTVLEIRRRQVWKKIVLEEGLPVDCRSNLVHETLGRQPLEPHRVRVDRRFRRCDRCRNHA